MIVYLEAFICLFKGFLFILRQRRIWRPCLPWIALLFRCPLTPWSHCCSLSWASVRKQVKLYESLYFTFVREHMLLASDTSIGPRLTVSNAVNDNLYHVTKTNHSVNLRILDVGCHALQGQLALLPKVCSDQISWRSDRFILSTSHLKTFLP